MTKEFIHFINQVYQSSVCVKIHPNRPWGKLFIVLLSWLSDNRCF